MACTSCDLVRRRDAEEAPDWDAIERTAHWDVVHATGTSLLGWTVLVLRRHARSLAELSPDEAVELGPLIRRVSIALEAVTGCEKTYAVQFAEHPQHPHVHVHVIPRSPDLDPSLVGPGIFQLLGVADEVPESDRDALAHAMREQLMVHRQ